MGLEDLGDEKQTEVKDWYQDKEEEEVEELKEELGIEHKEELEQFDDRLTRVIQSQIEVDRELEVLSETTGNLTQIVLNFSAQVEELQGEVERLKEEVEDGN